MTDLEHILEHTQGLWQELRGASLFVTGGTGFFGRWMVNSFCAANRQFQLGAKMLVLSRHPQQREGISFCAGDVRNFDFPDGDFSHVLHLATPASAALNNSRPFEMQEICVDGTRRVLEFSKSHGVKGFLLASSGAIYGRQPSDLEKMPEDFMGGPDPLDPRSAYAEGKRMAEWMCAASGLEVKIARGFAFLGPYLPLDAHFAAGNFIADALAARPVVVRGDGTAVRSYLYAADLAIWLWTILIRGQSRRAYNVGSEQEINIADLARAIAGSGPVEVRGTPVVGEKPERYVPSTARARNELHLEEHIDLSESIRRTIAWHRLVRSP
ncbi:MAG TPA: NAD-dependent epimerase/dehydratase family protein [Bryobacteraceae bacterium]|nr:NAD-dependent epimerase/dehydratase family protein [Bryobacteraceae bacterium]